MADQRPKRRARPAPTSDDRPAPTSGDRPAPTSGDRPAPTSGDRPAPPGPDERRPGPPDDVAAARAARAARRTWPPERPWRREGARIVQVSLAGTALFVATAIAAVLAEPARAVATIVALALFAAGTLGFLVAYGRAISRSRSVVLGVGGIYFLAGCAPRAVQFRLLGALALQTVVALVTASLEPFTSVAFGMLVPMFGLGMAGVWGAFHGEFPERAVRSASLPADE
jgi:hypothetical protein